MDKREVIRILQELADGRDQHGNAIPTDRKTIQALSYAIGVLDNLPASLPHKDYRRHSNLPANTGKPWTTEEDEQLLTEFDNAMHIDDIAKAHLRTPLSIMKRLIKHGKIAEEPPQSDGLTMPVGELS
jgi:hypothetical protein